MSLPEVDLGRYRELVAQAVEEATREGRPARAAWLAQRLKRHGVQYRVRDLGFASFADFLVALGGFSVSRDEFDVVASLAPQGSGPTSTLPAERLEKIHPSLWRAATRMTTAPLYLDREALQRDSRVEVTDRIPSAPGDHAADRYLEIPGTSQAEQGALLLRWAADAGLVEAQVCELKAALDEAGILRAIGMLRSLGMERHFMGARVEATKKRLKAWAEQHGIAWEPPLFERVARGHDTPQEHRRGGRGLSLREVVSEALAHLDNEELRLLRLPVGAVYDVMTRGKE